MSGVGNATSNNSRLNSTQNFIDNSNQNSNNIVVQNGTSTPYRPGAIRGGAGYYNNPQSST